MFSLIDRSMWNIPMMTQSRSPPAHPPRRGWGWRRMNRCYRVFTVFSSLDSSSSFGWLGGLLLHQSSLFSSFRSFLFVLLPSFAKRARRAAPCKVAASFWYANAAVVIRRLHLLMTCKWASPEVRIHWLTSTPPSPYLLRYLLMWLRRRRRRRRRRYFEKNSVTRWRHSRRLIRQPVIDEGPSTEM